MVDATGAAVAPSRPSSASLARTPGYLSATWHLFVRLLRQTQRQPIWLVVTIVQPILWLWLFGQLFRSVVTLPGFGAGSYLDFLTPGIVIMTALFGSAWGGMGVITEIDNGVIARMLTTPVHRSALIMARLLHTAVSAMVQALIILAVAYALGAHFRSGLAGVVSTLIAAGLLAAEFGALSTGFALLARREESVIAITNFTTLPLNFLSPILMAAALMPTWMRGVSRFNPVSWAVTAARDSSAVSPAWGSIAGHDALLLALALVLLAFATWTFRAYQRSM